MFFSGCVHWKCINMCGSFSSHSPLCMRFCLAFRIMYVSWMIHEAKSKEINSITSLLQKYTHTHFMHVVSFVDKQHFKADVDGVDETYQQTCFCKHIPLNGRFRIIWLISCSKVPKRVTTCLTNHSRPKQSCMKLWIYEVVFLYPKVVDFVMNFSVE